MPEAAVRIQVKIREMAANEIADMVPQATFDKIKQTDSSPLFKAFVVGHEGEARGNIVGIGNVVKRWFRSAVEKLHEKIRAGVQLFHGHGATNDQVGRAVIGEIVGKKLMEIGERLSSVVACYIYPAARGLSLDVASIEADVEMELDSAGVRVVNVGEVTAIALASSAIETPGFSGATLLGQLQAFEPEETGLPDGWGVGDDGQPLFPMHNLSAEAEAERLAEEARARAEADKEIPSHIDPRVNPMIRLD